MKRITFALSFVLFGVIAFGQGLISSPEKIRAAYDAPEHQIFQLSHSSKPGSAPETSDHGKDGEWLKYWETGVNVGALGLTEAGPFWAAIRWLPSDLAVYHGYSVYKIRIFMNHAPAAATAKIWQGDINNLTLMVSKEMPLATDDWVEVELDEPYMIDMTQELWIGWRVDDPGAGVFPAAYEESLAFDGLANILTLTENVWGFASDFGFEIVWNIEAFVEFVIDDDAPGAPQDFGVKAGEDGILEAQLDWDNPELSFAGEPLVNLDEIRIFRGNQLIHTILNPVVGASETFIDTGITEAGFYDYMVFAVNASGMSSGAFASAYIGEDVPAAPGNVTLIAVGNDGFVTWDAPVDGFNDEYFSGENLTYTVVRMPGEVTLAESIEAVEFLDTTVPGFGEYYYIVSASNHIGEGGSAVSNSEFLAAGGVLMNETFDYPTGALPPGWTLEGYLHAWTITESQLAGGQPPELRLTGIPDSPWGTGMSRLITYPIILGDDQELRLRFKQRIEDLTPSNDVMGIDVTYDNGDTWNTIWEFVKIGGLPPGEYEALIRVC